MKTIFNLTFTALIFVLLTSFEKVSTEHDTNKLKLTKFTDGAIVTNFIYENNQLIKTVSINSEDNSRSLSELFYENGRVSKRIFYDLLSSGQKTNLVTIDYFYTGNLITSDLNNIEGVKCSIIYSYDSYGVLSNRKEYDSYGALKNTYEYEYYSDGNLKKESKLSVDNLVITEFNSYDSKNNPVKISMPTELLVIDLISNNNILVSGETTFEYEYNHLNYPTKIIEKENGAVISTKILEYE